MFENILLQLTTKCNLRCRHFAMLYQLLAQEAAIESEIVRGKFGSGKKVPWHAWSIARKGSLYVLVDTTGTILEKTGESKKTVRVFRVEAETEGKCYKMAEARGNTYVEQDDKKSFYQYRRLS